MTLQYTSRQLAAMTREQLWAMAPGPVTVEFDPLPDGTRQVIESTVALTRFSAYFWGLLVEYPRTPSKIEHHIGKDRVRDNTHMTLLNRMLWDCHDAYQGEVDRESIWESLYRAYNRYYNDYTTMPGMEREISTISIEDLVEVVNHPKIAAAIEGINEANGTQLSIDHAHQVAMEVLRDPAALPGNPISCSVRSGTVSDSQILQCLIAHGPASDLSSRRFAEPIPSSFLSGMNSLFESMAESRTSTTAAAFKEKPIKESEYFNRQLQLLAGTVKGIIYTVGNESHLQDGLIPGDCGTERTVRWVVKDNKGRDLRALNGKYYVDDDGSLKVVRRTDKHLIGRTLHLRSVPLCKFSGTQSVCAVCYGEIALAMPFNTNIGHMAAVEYGERVTQRMLGIKHVNFASGSRSIELGPFEREFLEVGPSPREIRFKSSLRNARRVLLSFAASDVQQINEVFFDNIERLPVSRVSDIGSFFLTVEKENGQQETVQLSAEVQRMKSHLTHAFLRWVKEIRYTLSDTGRYVVDLTGFDFQQPVFEVPNRNENIMDYLNSIIRFITSSKPDKGAPSTEEDETANTLSKCRTLEEALMSFHELTSTKMEVNLVHLEVLVYATMVRSVKKRDYRLPGQGNALVFGQLGKIIPARSLSAALAFEGHSKLLSDPATYINQHRQDHPLDDLLVPRNAHA